MRFYCASNEYGGREYLRILAAQPDMITPVRNRRKYSGFQAGVDTPEAKIFRFVRKVPPEIFDRVALAFQRELKGS